MHSFPVLLSFKTILNNISDLYSICIVLYEYVEFLTNKAMLNFIFFEGGLI